MNPFNSIIWLYARKCHFLGANAGASGKVMYCNPDQGEFDNTRCQDGQRCVWEDIGFGLDFGVCKNGKNVNQCLPNLKDKVYCVCNKICESSTVVLFFVS